MTYYLRRTLRFLSKHHAVSAKAQGHFTALLGKGNTKATSSSHSNMVTKNFFIESCGLTEVMQGVVKDLKEYCAGSPIYSYAPKRADGDTLSLCVLPSHSDINASARVIVLMSETDAQPLWAQLSNELRTRASQDDSSQSLAVRNLSLEEQLMKEFFNNDSWKAPSPAPSMMTAYSFTVAVDPSSPPKEAKTVAWFRETRQEMRRLMGGTCML
jgi:hypothetical protein